MLYFLPKNSKKKAVNLGFEAQLPVFIVTREAYKKETT